MKYKKILVFTDWYLPGFKAGGPIRSVANIIESLKSEFDFSVITRNTDLGESEPYINIKSNEWNQLSGYKVYYISPSGLSLKNILKTLRENEYDVVYINGIFSFYFSILPLAACKFIKKKFEIIISPRGMLGPGPLMLKKNKKKIFLALAKYAGLYQNITWHASSAIEAREISTVFGDTIKIKNALNISLSPHQTSLSKIKNTGKAGFFFLSRISPIKNLIFALEILREIRTGDLVYDIYGPVEDKEYWDKCRKIIDTLPPNIRVSYKGFLYPHEIQKTISSYHFLLFPTGNENYGHSIVEALNSGSPVIISDRTPWKSLEFLHAGWDIPFGKKEKYIKTIEYCLSMDQTLYDTWAKSALDLGHKISENKEAVQQNRELFMG